MKKTEARRLVLCCLRQQHIKVYPKAKLGHGIHYRNRCVSTGRARGHNLYFKISRLMIRELASKGLLPGLKKASW